MEKGSSTASTVTLAYGKDDEENDTLLPSEVGSIDLVAQAGWYHNFANPVKFWKTGRQGLSGCRLASFAIAYSFILLIMLGWLGALGYMTFLGFTHKSSPDTESDNALATWNIIYGISCLSFCLLGTLCVGLIPVKQRPGIVTFFLGAGSIFIGAYLIVGCYRLFGAEGKMRFNTPLRFASLIFISSQLGLLALLLLSFCFCCTGRALGIYGPEKSDSRA